MWFAGIAAIAGLLAAPNAIDATAPQKVIAKDDSGMFTVDDLNRLQFLEGRWSGKAPDGSVFFEEYDFPDQTTMRSRRYADASFAKTTDGSTVVLKDGRVISTWGEFTWEASQIEEGAVTFRPLDAPGSFTWRRIKLDVVEVTQNWKDEKGAAQTYSLTLNRIR